MARKNFDLMQTPIDDYELSNGSPEIPSDSLKPNDENKKIHIMPRIGDEYQAVIPKLISRSEYMSQSSTNANIQKISMGLSIQLTGSKNDGPENLRPLDSKINGEIKRTEESRDSHGKSDELLVPGLYEYWSDVEKGGFILGMYIFLKDFVVLRHFIETKGLGAVMAYYYGKFYKHAEFKRWLECKKTKSRKCVFKDRIFSGLRQQELLCRIFPRVSEELRNAILEVSRTFGEAKMSLKDYVFSLRTMIGMKILVEAVGIGTGKKDLTAIIFESSSTNQLTVTLRPEIPTGKACYSLSKTEIIEYLRGDYRLSKARSNDLFWEAVWPRLLARGWHSEQPSNKSCLVFLGPGVKKFSRRKLVKGEHYFDSVSDVLSKVSNEPRLIELESDKNDEGELAGDVAGVENDVPKRHRQLYLQPRTAKRNRPVLEFMVVDTSLPGESKRELMSFPAGIPSTFFYDEDDDRDGPVVDPTVADRSRGKEPAVDPMDVDRSRGKMPVFDPTVVDRSRGKMPVDPITTGFENGSSSGFAGFHEDSYSRDGARLPSTGTSSQGCPNEGPSRPILIDLNLPQVGLEFDNGEQDNGPVTGPAEGAPQEELPMVNPRRRQSTRARPPTARALEAMANGYMGGTNRRRKARDPHEDVGPSSRPSRRARGRNEARSGNVGPEEA